MARITVEDCLEKEHNRFALVILIAKRAKQLLTGGRPTIENRQENKSVVLAAREVAEGTVQFGDIVPFSAPDSSNGESKELAGDIPQGQVA